MAVWTQLEKSTTSFHDISLHGVVSLRIQLQVSEGSNDPLATGIPLGLRQCQLDWRLDTMS